MHMIDVITRKKLGQALTREEIEFFVKGAADGSVPDYQLAALLMAIRLNGMTPEETTQLTLAMAHSGDMVNLDAIPGIPVDKHSTGGVGDTTTLVLAPLVAACGAPVAKMSGRGLGHTGGTLDKMESIKGLSIEMDEEAFIAQVQKIGLAVIGQSGELAPADKTLYALRDVTATVDSLPLIASSIMSKKLASGAKAIVLDVKTGSGAIMQTLEGSIELAQAMVKIGELAGRPTAALVTGMGQPLGTHVGNALEVKDAIDVLSGRTKGALLTVALALGSHMLVAAGVTDDLKDAENRLTAALESGAGLEKLKAMIAAQGGDPACCDDVSLLPQAPIIRPVCAPQKGYLESMDTQALGLAAQAMGAGRMVKTDVIDPAVGFVMHKRIGDAVSPDAPLFTLHARDEASFEKAKRDILAAMRFSPVPVEPEPLIYAVVTKAGIEKLAE